MKLATYKDGSRDGQLVVVSHDLGLAHYATGIATRLQQALDDWNFMAPQLQDLSETLDHGKARHAFAFDPQMCMAPLPRACGRAHASAYLSHLERLAAARAEPLPADVGSWPDTRLCPSDLLLGPTDDVPLSAGNDPGQAGLRPDFGAGLMAILGDVDAGVAPDVALEGVRLLTLVNDWRWCVPPEQCARSDHAAAAARTVASPDLTAWGGWAACAPVAVTVDSLGPAWRRGRLQARLQVQVNGQDWGWLDTAEGMHFHFGQLIAQVARQRPLRAGCLVSAGPISGRSDPWACASWLERGALQAQATVPPAVNGKGRALATPSVQAAQVLALEEGDRVLLDLVGADGASLCGAIDHAWVPR